MQPVQRQALGVICMGSRRAGAQAPLTARCLGRARNLAPQSESLGSEERTWGGRVLGESAELRDTTPRFDTLHFAR